MWAAIQRFTEAPAAASGRIASRNMGAARGTRLGLARDYAGKALDPDKAPDIGAVQHP